MTDVFQYFNEIITKMQCKNENLLTCTDKLKDFK